MNIPSNVAYYAAHAPDVPDWFYVTDAPPVPEELPIKEALERDPRFVALELEQRNRLMNTMSHPHASFPEPELAIVTEARRVIAEREKQIIAQVGFNAANRFYVWRWHYARTMQENENLHKKRAPTKLTQPEAAARQ